MSLVSSASPTRSKSPWGRQGGLEVGLASMVSHLPTDHDAFIVMIGGEEMQLLNDGLSELHMPDGEGTL